MPHSRGVRWWLPEGTRPRQKQASAPSGLSHKWCEGVSEASALNRKDAQRSRTCSFDEAEDAASDVEGRETPQSFVRRTTSPVQAQERLQAISTKSVVCVRP